MMARILCAAFFFLLPGCGSGSAMRPLHASVIGIDPPLESVPSAVVRVEWTNPGSDDVRIERYRLEWPGGSTELIPDGAVIPAGGTLVRTARVDLRSGPLPSDPATVRVVGVHARRS